MKTMVENKHHTKILSHHAHKLYAIRDAHSAPAQTPCGRKLAAAGGWRQTVCVEVHTQNRVTSNFWDCGPWTQGRIFGRMCLALVGECFGLNRQDWYPPPTAVGPDTPAVIEIYSLDCSKGTYRAEGLWVFGVRHVAPAYMCSGRPIALSERPSNLLKGISNQLRS